MPNLIYTDEIGAAQWNLGLEHFEEFQVTQGISLNVDSVRFTSTSG